jgi:hypothetical protein
MRARPGISSTQRLAWGLPLRAVPGARFSAGYAGCEAPEGTGLRGRRGLSRARADAVAGTTNRNSSSPAPFPVRRCA